MPTHKLTNVLCTRKVSIILDDVPVVGADHGHGRCVGGVCCAAVFINDRQNHNVLVMTLSLVLVVADDNQDGVVTALDVVIAISMLETGHGLQALQVLLHAIQKRFWNLWPLPAIMCDVDAAVVVVDM